MSSHFQPEKDAEAFREALFRDVGLPKTYKDGEAMITEGQASDSAIFIRKGTATILKGTKEVAKRSKGDLIGEMTLLLGDLPGSSVIAAGTVEAYVVQHSRLAEHIASDPEKCGRVFRMLASTLSDRISEASSKMRAEVVAKNAKNTITAKKPQGDTTLNVAKYRQLFALDKDEPLVLRTTCSMRKEANALKDANVSFGDMYLFEKHLGFDWKVFGFHKQQTVDLTDVVALLKSTELANTVEVQCKGYSLELTLPESCEDTWVQMEQCRRQATAAALQAASAELGPTKAQVYEEVDKTIMDALELGKSGSHTARESTRASSGSSQTHGLSMDLTEMDWGLFLSGAKQMRFKKGDSVLREGMPTRALYQILQGSLRVELQLKDQPTAVVVGHRGPGEMFGETSLLKSGCATASIVTDSEEAILVCVDGAYLESLFTSHPKLPGRFFAFLASYQAKRLRNLTEAFSNEKRQVAGQHLANVSIHEILQNPAYMGIFRKFISKACEDRADEREAYTMSLAMFEFWMDVQDFRSEPEPPQLLDMGTRIYEHFIKSDGVMRLSCFTETQRAAIKTELGKLTVGSLDIKEARKLFDEAQKIAVSAIEDQCMSPFLSSEHFAYILELKAKEGRVPGLPDFRLIRVLGQGGFGQVLEVVKRDCGKHYAMKVMHKEMMRRSLGSSWRRKIHLEKDLMACLHHPFLVNLSYAFQNTEFLVLVMDLVPAGDLSEFVLTKKRLTAEQVRFIMMEVVCVIGYCHQQNVLYRDMKPENLLIDEEGHVRMIDMGLAARVSKKQPKRRSRVGTDCYMAPEVRWAKDRREPYGMSCDWYTVGVLMYEFSAGTVPYAHPEDENPQYRSHDFKDSAAESLVMGLLHQDHNVRLGCDSRGIAGILDHPYWRGIDWDLVPLKKFDSPCVNLKAPAKRKKDKENLAVQIANDISEAEREAPDQEYEVAEWDFVSPTAVVDEYMENMYQCVSSI